MIVELDSSQFETIVAALIFGFGCVCFCIGLSTQMKNL
jgi:hypothetical protein